MNDLSFKLSGLTCAACVKVATSRIKKVPGVQDVIINLKSGDTYVSSLADLDLELVGKSLAGTPYSIVR